MSTQLFTRSLCASALILASGCAATVSDTDLRPMVPSVRLDPPRPGKNQVYFDFRDLTASGIEDDVFDALEDAILDRGWELASDYYAADYVLWADLRLFGEAGTEEGNKALNSLGAIAAGSAIGYGTARATDNAWAGVAAGTASGGLVKMGLDMMTRENRYQMVVDLVLGRKIQGGVETKRSSGSAGHVDSKTAISTETSIEAASGSSQSAMEQDLKEKRVHFDLEQRLLATTKGRRMSKDMAKNALIPKLVDGLKSQLPRVRG